MSETISWRDHQGEVIDSMKGFDVIECTVCGFKHVVPIPSSEEMNNYYAEQFLEKRPFYIDRINEDIEWWRMVYTEQYELFEMYLPVQRRSILDVGCGLGHFLELGKERGWNTLGIEPSRQACKYARSRSLHVLNVAFDEKQSRKLGTFDVINMHEVLEHISDPINMVRLCHGLIVPEGLFCIIVPNDYNALQRMLRNHFGYEPWWVSPLEHTNYFDYESLENLLRSNGFEILVKTTTFPMEVFLLMGDNYVGNEFLGRACHGRRKQLELRLKLGKLEALKQTLYAILAEHGIGREIVMLAKKV